MAFPFFKRGQASATEAAVHDPQQDEEARALPTSVQSDPGLVQFFGQAAGSNEVVTIESALGVPAVWAAVNFLSRTLAALPFKVFEKTDEGRAPLDGGLVDILNRVSNEESGAFEYRRQMWVDVFTAGRHVSFIERNGRGEVINLWPLEIERVAVKRHQGRTTYQYRDGGRVLTYAASDVLDLAYMPGKGGVAARSPIYHNAGTIGLAQAITRYGARFFNNGGVPPFTVTGPIRTAAGAARAAEDMSAAVVAAAENGSNAITVPEGHKLDALGFDPEKMQMIDAQRFVIEQVARIYQIPPAFLQDLTRGTFSNVEQQDLQLVKHLVSHWAKYLESEGNLKFFGRAETSRYVEHSLDGIMRGDFKTRADAMASKITTGQLTPDEARALDNRPPLPGGDQLYMQGAMMPAKDLGNQKGETDEE